MTTTHSASNAPDAEQQLSYLRELADAGRRTPLVGGGFGVLWGAIYTPPPLILYAAITEAITLPNWLLNSLFLIPLPIGILGSLWLSNAVSRAPGAQSFANKVASAAWGAAGFSIFIVFAGAFASDIFDWSPANTGETWGALMAVLFAVYGVAYSTTAFAAGFKGQALFGVLSFMASAAMVATLGSAEQVLIFGLALPFVSVLPGLIMMAVARKAAA